MYLMCRVMIVLSLALMYITKTAFICVQTTFGIKKIMQGHLRAPYDYASRFMIV